MQIFLICGVFLTQLLFKSAICLFTVFKIVILASVLIFVEKINN